jgi:hypothetical protein
MQPSGASDPTTAPERMLKVRARFACCIAEGATGVLEVAAVMRSWSAVRPRSPR